MANIVTSAAGLVGLLCAALYLHAVFRLHGVIAAERPEWVNARGALDFFYGAFPKAANPNVGAQVIMVALSTRARQLASPAAARYVRRIRLCLPVGVACVLILAFSGFLAGA